MENYATVPSGVLVQPVPFTLEVPEQDIADFKTLLKASKIGPTTYENQLPTYGVTRAWLTEAKEAWLDKFDWRAHERRINAFPNFKTQVQDASHGEFTLHFAALFSKRADAVPVVLLHGWPGSFLEFLPMMRLLAAKYTPETLPYHIIVPSLPGYTLSSGPPLDRDFDVNDLTRVVDQFMVDLGFGKTGYVAQGGDVGCMVARLMANYDACKAIHVNLFMAFREKTFDSLEGLTEGELVHLERAKLWRERGMAYANEHGTRPGTIGLVLSSNPLALLTWIGEKLIEWADERYPLDMDTMLAMVSLYWFTDSFPRCIFAYRHLMLQGYPPPGKPMAYSYFPYEIMFMPAAWTKELYPDMVRYEHDKGGHFAALEQPELLLADIEDFVAKNKDAFA